MHNHEEIARALVASGCLAESNMTLAIDSLASSLSDSEGQQLVGAIEDKVEQERVIVEATEEIFEFDEMAEFDYETVEREILAEATRQERKDDAIIAAKLTPVSRRAADALIARSLVDKTDRSQAAIVIGKSLVQA